MKKNPITILLFLWSLPCLVAQTGLNDSIYGISHLTINYQPHVFKAVVPSKDTSFIRSIQSVTGILNPKYLLQDDTFVYTSPYAMYESGYFTEGGLRDNFMGLVLLMSLTLISFLIGQCI